ncbi:hypothetical protein CCP2SC5_2360003 [Azospirillaceae bacterium]
MIPSGTRYFPPNRRAWCGLLVSRATVNTDGVRIDLRADGLATLAADLRPTLALEARHDSQH